MVASQTSSHPCVQAETEFAKLNGGGVALLAKRGAARAGELAHLADSVARVLITSGDAVSVDAA